MSADGLGGYQPYSAYKDSGFEWLGKIPVHWEVRCNRELFQEIDDRTDSGDEELLTVSHITGVTRRSEKRVTMIEAESHEGYKICRAGDLVVNTMWAWMGALGIARERGMVSPSYNIYRPNEHLLLSSYFDHVSRTKSYICDITRHSKGVWTSRLRLYPKEFKEIVTIVPPLMEQRSITTFLEHKTTEIDILIAKNEELLDRVVEIRDLLVKQAMDKAESKSARLGHVADLVARPIDRLEDQEYTPVGLYSWGRGLFHKTPTVGAELGESDFFWIREGDMIFSGQFAWEGAVALVSSKDDGCVASHRYPVVRGKPGIMQSAYLLAFFKSDYGHMLLDVFSRGAAGRNRPLNIGYLLKEPIPVPPLALQNEISALVHLEAELRETVANLVSHLQEYRAALISAAVTGKIDVRGVAKNDGRFVD